VTGRYSNQLNYRSTDFYNAFSNARKSLNTTFAIIRCHSDNMLFDAWQCPTLAWGDPTLPSALRRFTSEFGMGSGGTTALSPPGKFCFIPTDYHAISTANHQNQSCKQAENTVPESVQPQIAKTPSVL
jgi:hypothetical protein